MENKMIVDFTSEITPVKPINDQMTLCKCYIMAIGENRNKSNISKEAVDDALPTIYNIPIVGHLYEEDDETRMGGHDKVLEKDKDGKYAFKFLTVPFGVVPQQNNLRYEEVIAEDGKAQTYLVGDIILWTGRYPELLEAKYDEHTYFNQSMEIIPLSTEKKKGITNIDKFQFSALCLLGKSDDASKNVEPCFESSRVEPYDFSAEWTNLFGEFKKELAKCYQLQDCEEGGKELDTENNKTVMPEEDANDAVEFENEGESVNEVDTEEEAITTEETEESFKVESDAKDEEPCSECEIPQETVEQEGEVFAEEKCEQCEQPPEETKFFADSESFAREMTCGEIRRKLSREIEKLCLWSETDYVSYWLIDFDSTYVYVGYYIAGLNVEEQEGCERMSYAIVDGGVSVDTKSACPVKQVWLTKEDEEKLEAKDEEMFALQSYKADRELDDKRKAYGAVLQEFSDLADDDEFRKIAGEAMEFESLDQLREKCYAIRGKKFVKVEKKPLASRRFPVGGNDKEISDKDAFFAKYLGTNK